MYVKIVLIIGVILGFGVVIVECFVVGGWCVVVIGCCVECLQKLVDWFGVEYVYVLVFDMCDEVGMCVVIVSLLVEFVGIDLLVNNVGLVLGIVFVQQVDLVQWKQMIDINVIVLVMIIYLLLFMLIECCGVIVNISLIVGSYLYKGGNVYGGSKVFVSQFIQNLCIDLYGIGVCVMLIELGMVEIEFILVCIGGNQVVFDQFYVGVQLIIVEDIVELIWWIVMLLLYFNINWFEVMLVSQLVVGLQVYCEV